MIQQVLVGSKSLRPRTKVYPMVFEDSELAGVRGECYHER